jgi:hypothetical protein
MILLVIERSITLGVGSVRNEKCRLTNETALSEDVDKAGRFMLLGLLNDGSQLR